MRQHTTQTALQGILGLQRRTTALLRRKPLRF